MAVNAYRLMFQAGSRTIAGNLGGRFLHCMMRPAQGGALPPAGDYEILPPVSDPIYGRLALMVPVGGSGALPLEKHGTPFGKHETPFGKHETPFGTHETPFGKHGKPDASAVSALFIKFDQASPATGKPIDTHGAGGGQIFVLSGRPIVGRNCIVVSSGFADLMDGLQTAGGARVTVA